MKDQREVGPLSRGMMLPTLNPYPPHYRTTFACSLLLYPPCDGLALRLAFPIGHGTGLPRSAYTPGWVRLCLLRRWPCCLRGERIQLPYRSTVPVWLKPLSIFGLYFLTTFNSSSHLLAIPSDPSSRTALMLAVAISPRGLMTVPKDEATLSPELHTAGLLQPHVWVGYWWQHTRLCPPFGVITAVYATSCRTYPTKSNPSVICVIFVFSMESVSFNSS